MPDEGKRGVARQGVADAARKAKLPAVAAGSAALGVAGGVVLGRRLRPGRGRLLGGSNGAGELAKQLGRAGRALGQLSNEMGQVRAEARESNRQSPIEVVLTALTARRLPRH